MTIHILSWNIWFGTYLDNVIDFLQTSHADIIGLQEVTQDPNGKNNLAERLAEQLGYSYVYATGMDCRSYGKPFVMGNAVLSKFPIIGSKVHPLSKTDSRVAIQANIQILDTVFHVLSTHLLHTHQKSSKIQEEQAKTLVSVLPKDKTIVMGDFNATPASQAIQILRGALQNAGGDTFEPTWSVYPEGCEVCKPKAVSIRLDYLFTSRDMKHKKFTVHHSNGSDHLPISLDIEI